MRISPVSFGLNRTEKSNSANNYVPVTIRHNSLSDMDFNIIADTIRCQNLKNQMDVRLMNLKRSLNHTITHDCYQKSDGT